jgi:hypothetical protein
MPAKVSEHSLIVRKLLEKTTAGKVEWQETLAYPYRGFQTELAEGFSFIVNSESSEGDTTYSLSMKDSQGHIIFDLRLTDDPETMMSNEELYEVMAHLYDLARRKALKVDEKVERVAEILERI